MGVFTKKQASISIICLLLALCCGCLAQDGGESPLPETPLPIPQPPVQAEFDPEQAAVGLIEYSMDERLYDIYPIVGQEDAIVIANEDERTGYATIDCMVYRGPDEKTPPLFNTRRSGPYKIVEVLAGAEPDGQVLILTEDRLFRYNLDTKGLEDLGLGVPVAEEKNLDAAASRMIWRPIDRNPLENSLYIADLPDLTGRRVLWPKDPEGEGATDVRLNGTGTLLHFLVQSTPYRMKSVLYHLETDQVVGTQEWRTLPGRFHLVGETLYVPSYEPYVSEYQYVQVMDAEGVREVQLETPYLDTYGGQNGLLVRGVDDNLYIYHKDLSQHQLVFKGSERASVRNCFSTHERIYLLVYTHAPDNQHTGWLLTLEHPYAAESEKETP